jgi:hypothetical protein
MVAVNELVADPVKVRVLVKVRLGDSVAVAEVDGEPLWEIVLEPVGESVAVKELVAEPVGDDEGVSEGDFSINTVTVTVTVT